MICGVNWQWDIDFALGRVINIDRKYERAFSLRAPVSGLFIEWVVMRSEVASVVDRSHDAAPPLGAHADAREGRSMQSRP